MTNLSFEDCVRFQDCFLFDGKFYPFEKVDNLPDYYPNGFRDYYPLVLNGEIGSLINLSCKEVRSVNIYDKEIEDECADIFIYLLLFGRMLEIHDKKRVFGLIQEHWKRPVAGVITRNNYYSECEELQDNIRRFRKPEKERLYNEEYFYEIFSSIQQISKFKTGLEWQQVIDNFHRQIIQKHTDQNNFTPDGLYKGSSRINVDGLLKFTDDVGIVLPEKRKDFLKRMGKVQSHSFPSETRVMSAASE
jgi:hypothetical protein